MTHVSDITTSNSNDLGAFSRSCYIGSGGFRLLLVTADNTCIRSEGDQSPSLSTADSSGTSGYEGNSAICSER